MEKHLLDLGAVLRQRYTPPQTPSYDKDYQSAIKSNYAPQMAEAEIAAKLAQADKSRMGGDFTGTVGNIYKLQKLKQELGENHPDVKDLEKQIQLEQASTQSLVDRRNQIIETLPFVTLTKEEQENQLAEARPYAKANGWTDQDLIRYFMSPNASLNSLKDVWMSNQGKLPPVNQVLSGQAAAPNQEQSFSMEDMVANQLEGGAQGVSQQQQSQQAPTLDKEFVPTGTSLSNAQAIDAGAAGYDVVSKQVQKGLAHYPPGYLGMSLEQAWDQISGKEEDQQKVIEYIAARALAAEEASLQMNLSNLGTSSTLTQELIDKSLGNVKPLFKKMTAEQVNGVKKLVRDTLHQTAKAQSDSLKGIKRSNQQQGSPRSQEEYISEAFGGGGEVQEEFVEIYDPQGKKRRVPKNEEAAALEAGGKRA